MPLMKRSKGWEWGQSGKRFARNLQVTRQTTYASDYTGNAFCPNGPGGGVDPHCSPGESMSMVSPSTRDIDFDEAQKRSHWERHKTLKNEFFPAVDKLLGVRGKTETAIGAWKDGAENSTVETFRGASHEAVRVSAAMKGLLAEQKAVLAFQNDPDGPDSMWKVRVESKDVKETHKKLLKLGIENHTLVDHGTYHEVYIFDEGGKISDKVQSFQMKGGHHVEGVRGSGEFIGSWESRDEGASKYREVLSAFASNGQAHRDAVKQFHQLRRRWLSERVENRSQDQTQTRAIVSRSGMVNALEMMLSDEQELIDNVFCKGKPGSGVDPTCKKAERALSPSETSTKQYIEMVAKMSPKSVESLVAQHGQLFKPPKDAIENRKLMAKYGVGDGVIKECFKNAGSCVLGYSEKLTYVEGVAMGSILPVHHAWLVTPDGQVIDPTWRGQVTSVQGHKVRTDPGTAYYGVPLKLEYIQKTISQTGVYGIFDWQNKELVEKGLAKKDVKRITVNAALTPNRRDPTRTTTLQRQFESAMVKRFKRFRRELYKLVVVEDAFGLKESQRIDPFNSVANVDYSSTQLEVTDPLALQRIRFLQEKLDPADVVELETKLHITVKYGLLTDDPKQVEELVAKSGPIWVSLGNLEVFPAMVENAFCPTGEGGGVDTSCSPKGFDVLLDDKKGYVVRFDVGQKGFYFQASKNHEGTWDIGFGEEEKMGKGVHTASMTHDKSVSATKVLRGVERSLAKFIKTKDPQAIAFTSFKEDISRVKFYGRIAGEIGKTYGFAVSHKDYPAWKEYILHRSVTNSGNYDVLKMSVRSLGLENLNRLVGLLPNEDSHKVYAPHMTIAYLKPGTGAKYLQDPSFIEWQDFVFTKLTFSDKEEEHTELALNYEDSFGYTTNVSEVAEGRALNKPFRTPGGPKKFAVYTTGPNSKPVLVRFGDPNMEIKRDDPQRRKNFRARHSCDDDVGPKWKARYWSCKFWSKPSVSSLLNNSLLALNCGGKGGKPGPCPLQTADVREGGASFKTGQAVSFTYMRNLQKSPRPGAEDTFQQKIEPAGRYMTQTTQATVPGLETGQIQFKSPLVIPENTGEPEGRIYNETSWKMNLSQKYGGKTGKRLSQAIAKDGYDGIVTVKTYKGHTYTGEIVDISMFRPKLTINSLNPLRYDPLRTTNEQTLNTRWKFSTLFEKLTAFKVWLGTKLLPILTDESVTEDDWWRKYVFDGFQKGQGRVWDDFQGKGIPNWTKAEGALYAGSKKSFLESAFNNPESVDKVELLASRVFTELKGVTEAMSQNLTRALTDGLTQGKNPRNIASDIVQQVDGIGIKRARVIARTEIIRAHSEGQLDAMEKLGVKQIGVAVEWSATEDERVCPACADLQGIVLSLDEAKGLIPRHPNCRCAFIPANVGEDDSEQIRSVEKIKKAMARSARRGMSKKSIKAKKRSAWVGGSRKISSVRPKSILKRPTNNSRHSHGWPSWYIGKPVVNVFCATGKGGGVKPDCPFNSSQFSPEALAAENSMLDMLQKHVALNPREYRVAIDGKTGKIVAEGEGQKGSGEFGTAQEEARFSQEGHSKWVYAEHMIDMHTHPAMNAPPSDGDWGVFSSHNVRKLVVVEKDGTIWSMEKTKAWDGADWKTHTPRIMRDEYNAHLDRITDGEKFPDWTVEQVMLDVQDHMAKTFHVKLTKTKRPIPTANVFCPTGEGGGVDATCSPGEKGGSGQAITNPKVAAKAIAHEVAGWINEMRASGRLDSDPPSLEEIEGNWLKTFRSRKGNEGDKPAFKDLNPDLGKAIDSAIQDNKSNESFEKFVDKHGEAPVIYRRAEKGRSCAAEWRGGIHIYDSPFWKGEGTDTLLPGNATAGGMGGYAAVIRHEYGHKLYGKLTPEQQREWSSLCPASTEVENGLTSYAAKNREETFCELFAITTDKRYKPGVFPPWVDALHQKQKEWLL